MKSKAIGYLLLFGILGVLANNYAFLHDLVWGKGVITMGWLSGSTAAVAGVIAMYSLVVLFLLVSGRDLARYPFMPRPSVRIRHRPLKAPVPGDWRSSADAAATVKAAALGRTALGLAAMMVPFFIFSMVLLRPLVSPIEERALETSGSVVAGTGENTTAIELPVPSAQMLRFLSLSLSVQLPPHQSLPVRLEIRGGSPDGPSLSSAYRWNPGPESRSYGLDFTYFSWFHHTAYLVVTTASDSPPLLVERGVVVDYLQILHRAQKPFLVIVVFVVGLICLLFIPGSLFFALNKKRLGQYPPEERGKLASRVALALIAVLSAGEAWYAINTVFLPEFTHCNGQWGSEWNALDLHHVMTVKDLIPYFNYAPGRPVFFSLIIGFLTSIGFSPTGPVVTEVGYRVVQFAIALTANVFLFFYLVKLWRRFALPGPNLFPLIPVAVLSLHPELVFAYLSANVHTGMFFPIFIFLWIFSYRLIYEDRSWKGILLLGLACTFAYLWRNELVLVPYAFVLLVLLAMGIDRRNVMTCVKTLVVALFLPLLVMSKNYYEIGEFALHDASQVAIATSTHIGRGYQENANGFLYDDCYVARVAQRTAPDMWAGNKETRTNARRIYIGYILDQPVEFARAALFRMPLNVYALASNAIPACGKVLERVQRFVKHSFKNFVWLLLALNLGFLIFAFLRGGKEIVFVAFPAIYALYLVGAAGSGEGYFEYIFLTFIVTSTLGIAAAFHYAAGVMSILCGSDPPARHGEKIDDPLSGHQKAFFGPVSAISCLLLMFAAWQGLAYYSPAKLLFDSPPQLAEQHILSQVFERNSGRRDIRIKWGVKTDHRPMPYYDGHLIEVDGNLLVESYIGRKYVFRVIDPGTGETRDKFIVPFVYGCFEAFFTKRGNYLYTERQDTAGKPSVERIDLRDPSRRTLLDADGWIYSPILMDDHRIYYQAAGLKEFLMPVGVPYSQPADAARAPSKGWRFTEIPTIGELAQSDCCLYTGSIKDGLFFALNKEDGSEKWRFSGKANASIKPYVTGGSVIFVDAVGNIYELDVDDGSLIHETSLAGRFFADFEHADGVVYVGNMSGDFFAVELSSGKVLWETSGHGAVLAKPLLGDGYLYVASGRWLSKLDAASGKAVWEIDLGYVVRDTPLILGGRILVRTNGFVFALEEGETD